MKIRCSQAHDTIFAAVVHGLADVSDLDLRNARTLGDFDLASQAACLTSAELQYRPFLIQREIFALAEIKL